MFKLIGMEINTILGAQTILIWAHGIQQFSKAISRPNTSGQSVKVGLVFKKVIWASNQMKLTLSHTNYKDASQPAHL